MSKQVSQLYEFGPFRIDVADRLLLREGEAVPVTPKAFETLLVLVERRGHTVEKDELMRRLWPDTFVEEANLTNNISLLRKALNESPGHEYIHTVPRRGYRFVAELRQVSEDDLPNDRRTNLRSQPTELIGRDRDVVAVKQLLLREHLRLVTLTGTGGSGKTRLAIQIGQELVQEFEHGVYFIGLSNVSDPELVISTIAQVLGVREDGKSPIGACLKRYLQDKYLLLVVDNFEHLMPAALSIIDLLESCPVLRVLVTSRIVLRVRTEQEYQVLPLALPSNPRSLRDLETVSNCPSVALFVARTRAIRPDFRLTLDNAPVIATICKRLDGLPLAIELAAARMKMLTPRALLSSLDNSFNLLSDGARDLPARQQSIRSTMEWSYGLMSDSERILFRRLAVFVGGFTLEAADSVCGTLDTGPLPVMPLLRSLVDENIVSLCATEECLVPRYRMLETTREFGLEALARSGEGPALHRWHAEFYCSLAEQAAPMLTGPTPTQALDLVESELGNLRAAMDWAIKNDSQDLGLRIVGSTSRFWKSRGSISEGKSWVERLLSLRNQTSDNVSIGALRAATAFAEYQEDGQSAMAFVEKALLSNRSSGNKAGQAQALLALGHLWMQQKDYDQAVCFLNRSYSLFSSEEHSWQVAGVLNDLGVAWYYIGDFTRARSFHEKSMALYASLGDDWSAAIALNNIGGTLVQLGQPEQALIELKRCMKVLHKIGDRAGTLNCIEEIGGCYSKLGQFARAVSLAGAAESARRAGAIAVPGYSRSEYEEMMKAARDNLSSEEFEDAWQKGRALSFDDAVGLALRVDSLS